MDIEKLIKQLKWWAEECDRTNKGCQARRILQDAATAISTLQAENAQLLTELEQVKRERDAAIKRLRKIDWCAGCKDFCGLDGCAGVGMESCTVENDHYQFGPEES